MGDNYEGQHAPHFKVILAEIVAECICRRALALQMRQNPLDFELAELHDDNLIAQRLFTDLHTMMRDFVAEAHEIMLSTKELNRL